MYQPSKAPYFRPGAVLHEPSAAVDDLIGKFALTLKDRGFAVAGCLRHQGHLIDLATTQPVPPEATGQWAAKAFRGALRDDADLVAIGDFDAATAAAREMQVSLDAGLSPAMPLLTALPGSDIQRWLDFAGHKGTMLFPNMKSLWHWWGAEQLYHDLALGVANDEVRQITHGPRWLMVQGPAGAGLAYLPRAAKDHAVRLAAFKRMSLKQLAALAPSWDPLEMAVGMAAINAHYNRFDLDGAMGNGADAFGDESGRVVVVGAFPGLADVIANPQIIETEPRPGEFPTGAMDTLLPGCAAAVVASSTLINRSAPRILRLAHGSRIALIGPITPLSPRLYHYGVEVLGGLVVHDPDGLAGAVRAGAMPREFQRFGHYVHIRHERQADKPVCRFRAIAGG
jgi:uncharacterized protein (DUF4213/DUF364 family)